MAELPEAGKDRHMKKRMNSSKTIILKAAAAAIALVMTAASCGAVYFSEFYHAAHGAQAAMAGSDTVKVEKLGGGKGYLFDGPGEDRAFTFLQGGKVEEEAYAPLMMRIAQSGTDCFLISSPANFALFDRSEAVKVAEDNEYAEWYIGGHSLGGVAASMTAAEYDFMFSGIVLLGAYPAEEVPGKMRLLSIYGSEDGVLDMDSYKEGKKLWPKDADEVIIEGGSHAGFGDYGPQKGDGKPSMGSEEQIEKTADAITEWIGK